MDEARQGQIALACLKLMFKTEGIRLTPNLRRDIGNKAQALGIPTEEAMEFAEILVRELVEETFKKPQNRN